MSLRLLLFFSVLCAVISITPVGDDWQVLVRLAPEWTSHPNGYPYLMPHEVILQAIVSVWQGVVQAAANSGWLTDPQAAALIADGLPLNGVLQAVAAFLFVLVAFMWAVASVRGPKVASLQAKVSVQEQEPVMTMAEPVMAVSATSISPVVSPSTTAVLSTDVSVQQRLSSLELQVANLLLNPDAQPVAEELVELNRELRELSRALNATSERRS